VTYPTSLLPPRGARGPCDGPPSPAHRRPGPLEPHWAGVGDPLRAAPTGSIRRSGSSSGWSRISGQASLSP